MRIDTTTRTCNSPVDNICISVNWPWFSGLGNVDGSKINYEQSSRPKSLVKSMMTDVREIVNGIRMINTLFILVIRSVLSQIIPLHRQPPGGDDDSKLRVNAITIPVPRHHNGRLNSLNAVRYQRTRRSRLITDDYWSIANATPKYCNAHALKGRFMYIGDILFDLLVCTGCKGVNVNICHFVDDGQDCATIVVDEISRLVLIDLHSIIIVRAIPETA